MNDIIFTLTVLYNIIITDSNNHKIEKYDIYWGLTVLERLLKELTEVEANRTVNQY